MKKLLFTFAFVLIANLGMAQSQAFRDDVMKYFDVSGTSKGYEKMISTLSANVPAEKQADFKKAVEVRIKDLQDKMADYYMSHLTHDDIKAAIQFYESPAGKKIVETSQSEELMKLAEKWGLSLSEVMMEYISY